MLLTGWVELAQMPECHSRVLQLTRTYVNQTALWRQLRLVLMKGLLKWRRKCIGEVGKGIHTSSTCGCQWVGEDRLFVLKRERGQSKPASAFKSFGLFFIRIYEEYRGSIRIRASKQSAQPSLPRILLKPPFISLMPLQHRRNHRQYNSILDRNTQPKKDRAAEWLRPTARKGLVGSQRA